MAEIIRFFPVFLTQYILLYVRLANPNPTRESMVDIWGVWREVQYLGEFTFDFFFVPGEPMRNFEFQIEVT